MCLDVSAAFNIAGLQRALDLFPPTDTYFLFLWKNIAVFCRGIIWESNVQTSIKSLLDTDLVNQFYYDIAYSWTGTSCMPSIVPVDLDACKHKPCSCSCGFEVSGNFISSLNLLVPVSSALWDTELMEV